MATACATHAAKSQLARTCGRWRLAEKNCIEPLYISEQCALLCTQGQAIRQAKTRKVMMMKKQEFKAMMREFRKSLSAAVRNGKSEFCAIMDSNRTAEACLRPKYAPVVSRNVMLHIFSVGGLEAISHIGSVEVRYN